MASETESLYLLLNKYGVEMTKEMKTRLKGENKLDTKKLYNSIEYKILETNDSVELQFLMEEYGEYVDQGRRPGKQPPLSKIQAWCRRKKIPVKAAFPIARKIGRFGTPATYFMTITVSRRQKQFEKDVENVMSEAVQKKIEKFLKQNPTIILK